MTSYQADTYAALIANPHFAAKYKSTQARLLQFQTCVSQAQCTACSDWCFIDVSWLLDNSFITQILMMTDSAEKVTCWIWIETIVDNQCTHARAQVLALFFVVFWEENYGSSDEEAHCDTLGLPDFPPDMADNDRAQWLVKRRWKTGPKVLWTDHPRAVTMLPRLNRRRYDGGQTA